jgi:hypothetical protein
MFLEHYHAFLKDFVRDVQLTFLRSFSYALCNAFFFLVISALKQATITGRRGCWDRNAGLIISRVMYPCL